MLAHAFHSIAHKAHDLVEDAEIALHFILEIGHLAHSFIHLFH